METQSLVSTGSAKKIVAILAFHKIGKFPVGGWNTWNYIPESTFGSQLSYLRENGWQVIDLATFLRGLAQPDTLPERTALLTFDDGYRSMLKVTLPWLQRFGYPAVLFVPTDFIGGSNTFDAGIEPEEAICDWDELQQLEHYGVSVQSHGVSHRPFSQLEPDEQKDELVCSKVLLESRLGKVIEVFCYPYGDSGVSPKATSQMLQQAGYRAACLYGGGPNSLPMADQYWLSRLAMGPDTDLQEELG